MEDVIRSIDTLTISLDISKFIKKRFLSDFCEKKFAEKRLLKRHIVVHQNINPYTCEKCSKGFKHNNQLYRHRKKCLKMLAGTGYLTSICIT